MKYGLSLFLLMIAAPLSAKDSLGVFGDWGAFRDPAMPRCYAIASAAPSSLQRDQPPYASVGTWPKKGVRNQLHLRLSRRIAPGATISLTVADRGFELVGSGSDAWARDRQMDAAIIAAMRSASRMVVRSTDAQGRRFSNSYDLDGVATAMDAASVGCARLR